MKIPSTHDATSAELFATRSEAAASPEDTVRDLLKRSKRNDSLPIRRAFIQDGLGKDSKPGPLSTFVGAGDQTALDLYLLAKAVAAAGDYDVAFPSEVWLRAMRYCGKKIGAGALSRAWKRLVDRKLIRRQKRKRLANIVILDESGNGSEYTRPGSPGPAKSTPYFKLTYRYWYDGWCSRLSLPGKAMLLVALTQDKRETFSLPLNRMPKWYGFSTDTAQRGFDELKDFGLLDVRILYKKAPLTAAGITEDRKYALLEPFTSRRKQTDGFISSGPIILDGSKLNLTAADLAQVIQPEGGEP